MNETIIVAILGVLLAILIIVKLAQHLGLEGIREYVYTLFEDAEKSFEHGDNEAKLEYVVNLAKTAIPSPFNLLITKSLLKKTIQAWFDLVKDLLDDGKLNSIIKKEDK